MSKTPALSTSDRIREHPDDKSNGSLVLCCYSWWCFITARIWHVSEQRSTDVPWLCVVLKMLST